MPLSPQDHIENLVRHIDLVKANCLFLGRRLMSQGRVEFGKILVSRGYLHDNSKFFGIEWDYLHAGKDIPQEVLQLAIKQHQSRNEHHPEFWGGIENMPEIAIAEMVCDWYARSSEFASCLRDWIENVAVKRYGIDKESRQYEYIVNFTNLLVEDMFVR